MSSHSQDTEIPIELTNESMGWIPYGQHTIEQVDIDAMTEVMRTAFLTTGPKVHEFESAVEKYVGSGHAVAVNNGTAALHTMLKGFNIGPGDEVIVPSITFAATATAVIHAGATPVFADVDSKTALLDVEQIAKVISEKTRAVIAVDFAGQVCDYDALRAFLAPREILLFSDACHSLGGRRNGKSAGSLADATTFSFHPVKPITTGEGGMVITPSADAAERMKKFRNHGISVTHAEREKCGDWFYEINEIGMNYRLTDFQCALGLSQLDRLNSWIEKRQLVARTYDGFLKHIPGLEPLDKDPSVDHAYHLYVIRVDQELAGFDRQQAFKQLRDHQIGVNVHYIPVHLHPFFRREYGTQPGTCPNAERYYDQALTLPIFPAITEQQIKHVVDVLSGT